MFFFHLIRPSSIHIVYNKLLLVHCKHKIRVSTPLQSLSIQNKCSSNIVICFYYIVIEMNEIAAKYTRKGKSFNDLSAINTLCQRHWVRQIQINNRVTPLTNRIFVWEQMFLEIHRNSQKFTIWLNLNGDFKTNKAPQLITIAEKFLFSSSVLFLSGRNQVFHGLLIAVGHFYFYFFSFLKLMYKYAFMPFVVYELYSQLAKKASLFLLLIFSGDIEENGHILIKIIKILKIEIGHITYCCFYNPKRVWTSIIIFLSQL